MLFFYSNIFVITNINLFEGKISMGGCILKPNEICMSAEQMKRFLNFIFGNDLDFYEEFTIHLSDEEQERFFDDNPDFMSKYLVKCDMMYLMKDWMFRRILRKIGKCEGGR